jgi:hypothetical protein
MLQVRLIGCGKCQGSRGQLGCRTGACLGACVQLLLLPPIPSLHQVKSGMHQLRRAFTYLYF